MTNRSERIAAGEAAVVCSHYDLGVVEEVRRLSRGSRHTPKVILRTTQGLFLLKRRGGPGARTDARRVALSHETQTFLARAGFPVPRLLSTRAGNRSMVELGDRVYEVYEVVPGAGYDRSVTSTLEAGRILGVFHRLLADFHPTIQTHTGGYHALKDVGARLVRECESRDAGRVARRLAKDLADEYQRAAAKADAIGIRSLPEQVIHADWHPGNLVFRGHTVAGVVDLETVCLSWPILDVANGALQFSMRRAGEQSPPSTDTPAPAPPLPSTPDAWPVQPDEARLSAFVHGWTAGSGRTLSAAESDALAWLMIEALVVEAVAAVRGLGRSHLLDPAGLLAMVMGKAVWLRDNARRVSGLS
ncbi:MAG: phosphotransferase [Phycisphaeraceae bacterium]|nr:phosphotransferase [Phycisphaeraceae bacterium]